VLNENYEIWLEGVERAKYPRGFLPEEVEVLIIGGGITGITSSYLLAKAGKKVVLLEKGKIGEGVTDCTTGFLTGAIDTDPIKLVRVFGVEKAKLILASHLGAISAVEKIIRSEKIDCEFERCTNYIYANNKREEKRLIKTAEAYKKLGVTAEYKKENKLKFNEFGYIEMHNQAKFHVMKYVFALSKIATKYGAIIAEDSEVLRLEDKKDFINVEVKNVGIIKSKKVVSATYVPFQEPKNLSGLGNMYHSYVIEYKLPQGALITGTYEDTLAPYHYFRIDYKDNFDRLIIGGADHLDVIKMNREINCRTIEEYTKRLFAKFKPEEILRWSGMISETNDSLAYIGESDSKNVFYAFGFSGNGMTYSYIAGKILLDKLLSVENPYAEIYSINRKISWWKKLYLK
jgi:glycine/D-amino acid oxidase-like deaminating enzyme